MDERKEYWLQQYLLQSFKNEEIKHAEISCTLYIFLIWVIIFECVLFLVSLFPKLPHLIKLLFTSYADLRNINLPLLWPNDGGISS